MIRPLEATLKRFFDLGVKLAKDDARNKGQEDRVKSGEYRGIAVHRIATHGGGLPVSELAVPAGGEPGLWRVGFTKFATRMLGELVEAQFKAYPLTPRLRCTSGGGCGAREAEGNS